MSGEINVRIAMAMEEDRKVTAVWLGTVCTEHNTKDSPGFQGMFLRQNCYHCMRHAALTLSFGLSLSVA